MIKSTDNILNEIKNNKIINYNEEVISIEPHLIILNHLEELNVSKSSLIKGIDLDMNNGYKYLSGERKLKRDVMIKMLIFLELDFNTINQDLKKSLIAPLYPKVKRDKIIIHNIFHKSSLEEINDALSNEGLIRL